MSLEALAPRGDPCSGKPHDSALGLAAYVNRPEDRANKKQSRCRGLHVMEICITVQKHAMVVSLLVPAVVSAKICARKHMALSFSCSCYISESRTFSS